ncbi:MAG: WD40 repeat domain-containing protein [Bacteroidota bacterium]
MPTIEVQKITQLTGHNAAVYALSPGPEAPLFLSGAGEGWVAQWDLRNPKDGQLVAKVESNIFALCYLPAQHQLVVGNMHGGIHWVDLSQSDQTKNIAHHQGGVFAIRQIGDFLYTLGGEGLLTRWSIAEQRSLESFHLTNQSLRCLAYHPKKNELAIGASDHAIYLLDAQHLTVKEKREKAHDNSVFSLQYTPDGQRLISGGRDAHLKVWTLESGLALISDQSAHWYTINHIAIHPTQAIFATASRDKTIKIWDLHDYRLLKVLDKAKYQGHGHSVNGLYWSTFGDYLISCSDDRTLIIWEVRLVATDSD